MDRGAFPSLSLVLVRVGRWAKTEAHNFFFDADKHLFHSKAFHVLLRFDIFESQIYHAEIAVKYFHSINLFFK